MKLTSDLPAEQRAHVEARLRSNLMVWLTTVRPSGQPDSVPVWFLFRDDETILIYSQPGTQKLRNLRSNPRVALGLDVTDIGRDIIRSEGTAAPDLGIPPADQNVAYVSKYAERVGAMFGTPERFASAFSTPILITPGRLWSDLGRPTVPPT